MQTTSTISFVISDWSGVISDDRKPVYEAAMRVLDKYKMPKISFNAWLRDVRPTAEEFFWDQGIRASGDALRRAYEHSYTNVIEEGKISPTIYPGVPEALRRLAQTRIRVAVVSSHPTGALICEAIDYKIDKYISWFIGNSTNKAEDIHRILKRYRYATTESAFVGDSGRDIEYAKRAGVMPIGVLGGYNGKEHLENALDGRGHMLRGFSELPAFLKI